jgi:hypothetical protein
VSFISFPEHCWNACLEVIPDSLYRDFFEYVAQHLQPVDFMPSPNAFLVDSRDDAVVEQKRREMRPKYVAFFNALAAQLP